MFSRSVAQILSLKDEGSFFPNFLIIGLCNSSANCWLHIISLLTLKRLRRGSILPPPVVPKTVFCESPVKPCFFCDFQYYHKAHLS